MSNNHFQSLPPLREIIKDIAAKKSLGQNFLCDLQLTRKIARCAGAAEGETFLEIGAGPGGLTRGLLLEGASHVTIIEKDARFLPILQQIADCYAHRLKIYHADALTFDFSLLPARTKVVANLPYCVATPILLRLLKETTFDSMTLMFQKEVADRLMAAVNTPAYGRLSVITQLFAHVQAVMTLPPDAFVPSPKITSKVVRITRHTSPLACNLPIFEHITAAAFGQRRKMLRTALKDSTFLRHHTPEDILTQCGINPSRRAETLSTQEYVLLSMACAEL